MGRVLLLAVALLGSVSACAVAPSEVPPWARGQGIEGPAEPPPAPAPAAEDAGTGTPDAATSVVSPEAAAPVDPADAVAPEPAEASAPIEAGKASGPTWTDIFNSYLALGTVGNCGSCHGQADNPSDTYKYLSTSFAPKSFASAFTWSGGNMPLSGSTTNPQASADVAAWVAAGALNN